MSAYTLTDGPTGNIAPDGDPHGPSTRPTRVTLDIVVPVYNEEFDLPRSVSRLHDYLSTRVPMSFRITVADNASTDGTAQIADRLATRYPDVRAVHLPEKGRGRALKQVWLDSDADVLVYMDVDLSTDLSALLPLVAPLVSGHSDLAIGTRLHRGSRVIRGPKREIISRCYNLILRGTLAARFSDAQCGFKAIRRTVAAATPAAGPGQRLVLRHRTAGAGRTVGVAHPRGAGGLDRRPGLPGGHRADRHG